jgi:NADH:ubiquinone oxidoreductase subunit E
MEGVAVAWDLDEAADYYKKMGAPSDQNAVINLLREIQQENGGSIPEFYLAQIAQRYEIKETFLRAVVSRIPSLRLKNMHILEMCAGPNCGKHVELAAMAERLQTASGNQFTLKFTPCKRMCGKGPNIRWDGEMYHKANETLLKKLLKDAGIEF